MGTPTYTALANITLGSSASSVTFSSIPATFRDLVLICVTANGGSGANNGIRFNSDTGSNYTRLFMGVNGVGAFSSGNTTSTGFQYDNFAFSTPNLGRNNHILNIMDYSATDKHKTILARANREGDTLDALTGRWANTSAVTTLNVYVIGGGDFLTGSSFALYGIAS